MKLDFIGHEIREDDKLWIIRGDLTRIEAYRDCDKVIPYDEEFEALTKILKDGKNSRVDLRRCWYENYLIKQSKII